MLIGYARISCHDQNLSLQRDALTTAGCEKIFTDVASGGTAERAGLIEATNQLRSGDTLVVWRLDRLGRSLRHLIEIVTELKKREIGFRSVTEGIETQTSGGRLVFHLFACLAEFERSVIQERTRAGLAAAKSRGRCGGRPKLMDERKIAAARAMRADPDSSASDICHTLGISRATLYRSLKTEPKPEPIIPQIDRPLVLTGP